MRHRKNFNHLGRKSAHRKAMLANMATSLILHKRIKTTVAKAKALRQYVEPLITKSKNDTTHSRRIVFSYFKDKYAVTELFREISVKVGERPGGYTRIIKLGSRLGDNAEMCFIELVDYNDNLLTEAKPKAKKRSRRGGSGSSGTKKTTQPKDTTVKEETKEEIVESKVDKAAEEIVEEKTVDNKTKKEETTKIKVAEEKKEPKPKKAPKAEVKKEEKLKEPKKTPKTEAKKDDNKEQETKEEK